jgi:putative salt-induced outer membrane protein YdiY
MLLLFGAMGSARAAEDAQSELERLRRENALLAEAYQRALRANTDLRVELAAVRAARPGLTEDMLAAEAKVKSPWKVDVAVGGNYNTGNTNSYLLNVRTTGVRQTDLDRLVLTVTGDIGETENQRSAEKALGSANFRRTVFEQLFWLANAAGETDALADLDYRFTLSPGLGYYLWKSDPFTLSVEGGPAYVLEQFEGAGEQSRVAGRLAEELNWQANERVRIFQNAEVLADFGDSEDWIFTGEFGLETSLTKTLAVRLTARDRFTNQPATGRDKNDLSIIGSLVYTFD